MLPKNYKFSPSEPPNPGLTYTFGPYRVVPSENLLLRNDEKLPLKPKTFELLVFLLDRRNRVVTKADIINGVWSDSFVEEANLAVHVSALRKIFADNGNAVSIDTIPKIGYRLNVDGAVRCESLSENGESISSPMSNGFGQIDVLAAPISVSGEAGRRGNWRLFVGGAAVGILALGTAFYFFNGQMGLAKTKEGETHRWRTHHSFKTERCPEEANKSLLIVGGCEEAVASFSLSSNPNGNWSYGYTTNGDFSDFALFRHTTQNHHFFAPEVPSDIWRRPEEWQPSILRNTSPMTVVIQDGVVVPPHMFEMHPGPKGERSVLRWTAPVDGSFLIQGQFRGLNTNGDTTTDVLVIYNNKIYFTDNVIEYNRERPFEVNFKMVAGETVDFSVGYGSNEAYECDSTGVSVMVTTMALTNSEG